jgi:hypothetical protein
MIVLAAFTAGLVFWISAWSLGLKSFDAFLVTIALTLAAVTFELTKPFLDQLLGRENPEDAGYRG